MHVWCGPRPAPLQTDLLQPTLQQHDHARTQVFTFCTAAVRHAIGFTPCAQRDILADTALCDITLYKYKLAVRKLLQDFNNNFNAIIAY